MAIVSAASEEDEMTSQQGRENPDMPDDAQNPGRNTRPEHNRPQDGDNEADERDPNDMPDDENDEDIPETEDDEETDQPPSR